MARRRSLGPTHGTADVKRGAFIAILVFGALAGCGLVVWGESSDGTKQSDLGAAIFGGAIVGAALIVVERAWSAERTERRKDEVMDAERDARRAERKTRVLNSPHHHPRHPRATTTPIEWSSLGSNETPPV